MSTFLTSELQKPKLEYHTQLLSLNCRKRPEIVWKYINEVLQNSRQREMIGELSVDRRNVAGVSLAEHISADF